MPKAEKKAYLHDTHRLCDPAQTLAAVRPHLAGMGITRIANLTGLDRVGLPTVMVTRPNSRSVAVSLGKGLTLEAAQASGVMEAIETWHAERVTLPLRLASFQDLQKDALVADVERLPRVTGTGFNPQRRMLWIEGTDLATDKSHWLPYEMVDTDYTSPPCGGQGAFPRTTNGLASGNNLAEATCHAICELIERDAITLWHHAPAGPRVDPAAIDDPRCRVAMDRFAAAGLQAGVWDITSDIGVAAFHCMICETGSRPGHIGIGSGCHPDRNIALLRSLTEAAQTRLTYISGARDDLDPEEFTPSASAERAEYVRSLLTRTKAVARLQDCPSFSSTSFEEDRAWLLRRLRAAGMQQVLIVDLSRRDLGISVVRAVIPGLEAPHDDPDFIPGGRASRTAEASI
ncbi:YcaO-like family protein [Leisingera daeponensis]|uniref:YcaO-like family protein n=1 Tax=Leisingera daeponensis TaxID=405746 RepID=A0ABS7NIK9_9RHOB|nr:YcaO-like family protein [Leisingera daeponensis]MBY6141030.1 YcaO-like family protein [Leisingera daeponensis]